MNTDAKGEALDASLLFMSNVDDFDASLEQQDGDNNPSYDMDVDDELINAVLYYSNHLDADEELNTTMRSETNGPDRCKTKADCEIRAEQHKYGDEREQIRKVRNKREKDKIGTKPDKNEKREALDASLLFMSNVDDFDASLEQQDGDNNPSYDMDVDDELINAVLYYSNHLDADDELNTTMRRSIVSGGKYFSWSGSGRSVEAPSWMERLWAGNGGGTGVFIPRVVPPSKSRRRRNNKPKRNNNGVMMVHS
nr:hypothetical protein [Tanacetum cinerariifolium]